MLAETRGTNMPKLWLPGLERTNAYEMIKLGESRGDGGLLAQSVKWSN